MEISQIRTKSYNLIRETRDWTVGEANASISRSFLAFSSYKSAWDAWWRSRTSRLQVDSGLGSSWDCWCVAMFFRLADGEPVESWLLMLMIKEEGKWIGPDRPFLGPGSGLMLLYFGLDFGEERKGPRNFIFGLLIIWLNRRAGLVVLRWKSWVLIGLV